MLADSFVTVPILKSLCHAVSGRFVTMMRCNRNALYAESYRAREPESQRASRRDRGMITHRGTVGGTAESDDSSKAREYDSLEGAHKNVAAAKLVSL